MKVRTKRLRSPFHNVGQRRADAIINILFGPAPGKCFQNFADCHECGKCLVAKQCATQTASRLGLVLVTAER